MILRSTSQKIVLTTATSADVDYHFTYSDLTTEATDGSSYGKITTATNTDVVAAPSASTGRIILEGLITNVDTISQTVTVLLDVSATTYRLHKTTLEAGETLQYVKGNGWQRYTASGELAVTVGAGSGSGNTLLNGTTDPSNDLGVNGDFYINTTTKEIFGPKESGVWGAGTSISVGLGFSYYDGTGVLVSNTASETQVSSSTIPANSLNNNGDSFSFMSFAQLTNNTGVNRTVTLRINVGATTVYQDVTGNIATSAVARAVTLEGRVIRTSATTAEIQMTLQIGSVGTATTGLSDMGVTDTLITPIKSVLNVAWNWATNTDLVSTIQLSFAATTFTYDHKYHLATAGGPKGADGAGGGGGGTSWTDVTVTDANFTAANDTRYYIPAGVLSANRTVNMGSVTTKVMFINAEPDYFLNFSTATVYIAAGSEEISSLMAMATTHIEKIDTKLIVIN